MGKTKSLRFLGCFLIGSFSYLQVMRTYIKAYLSLNFRQIPPLTTELATLERLKNRCHHVISVDIDPIFFKLAGNKDMHNIMNEFEFRPDRTTDYGVVITVEIDPIFFKLAGNKDMHNIMNEFEFRPDRTTEYGVSCPWASKNYPHRLIMGKMMFPLFLCCFWLDPFDTFM